jgi:ABC-type sugar transport system ATPase subunit
MNFLDCSVRREEGRVLLQGNGFRIPVDPAWFGRLRGTGRDSPALLMGIRPEHIRLHSGRDSSRSGLIEGKVYVEEPLGTDVIFDIEIGDRIVRVRALADQTKALALKMGDTVFVELKPDSLYLFDSATEATILQAQFALQQEVAV